MEYYKKIQEHIKNKFLNDEKIEEIKKLPSDNEIDKLSDNKIYKIALTCIAVDIVESKKWNEKYKINEWSKIFSEFSYGISKIMREFDGKWITIQGDGIYCIFNSSIKKEIDSAFNCCCALNTFKEQLNNNIEKYIKVNETINTYDDNYIDYGIGMYFSSENYISKIGIRKERKIVFMGDAVNYANMLSKEASRNNYESILFNDLIEENFTEENKQKNNENGSFKYYYNIIENETILGCDWVLINYNNFIENSI